MTTAPNGWFVREGRGPERDFIQEQFDAISCREKFYRDKRYRNRLTSLILLLLLLVLMAIGERTFFPRSSSIAGSAIEVVPTEIYYRNCAAARAAGVAPIYRGEPGYESRLDADSDGIACEPFRR